MAIYEFDGYRPVVHESSFVHPQAAVTGNVVIGRDVYVGPGAALRADWGEILIGDGCNVQEGCVIHVFPGATVVLEDSAHLGHGSIIHGATIGRNTLVGMNAVVMDGARIVKDVTDEMIAWKTDGTRLYQRLPSDVRASWRECEPLREVPASRPRQSATYRTWRQTRG